MRGRIQNLTSPTYPISSSKSNWPSEQYSWNSLFTKHLSATVISSFKNKKVKNQFISLIFTLEWLKDSFVKSLRISMIVVLFLYCETFLRPLNYVKITLCKFFNESFLDFIHLIFICIKTFENKILKKICDFFETT